MTQKKTTAYYVILVLYCLICALVVKFIMYLEIKCKQTFNNVCWLNTKNKNLISFLKKIRGRIYYLNYINSDVRYSCIFSYWDLMHLLFHIPLGYYTNIYTSMGIGISWELFESIFGHQTWTDMIWNTSGFLIGKCLSKIITNI